MTLPLIQVDAFTDRAFAGNPAAVCLLSEPAEAAWMARVAAEMNLAETAFLVPRDGGYDLRWFTPTVEVPLCGHATLASAHALWELGAAPREGRIAFHTKSGLLTAERKGDLIWLDFPSKPMEAAAEPERLAEALGVAPRWCGSNGLDYLVEVDSEAVLRAIQPDHRLLRGLGLRGVIVTAAGSAPYDFISRFFAPGSGIDEDPVTGSAHCALAPYWAPKLGKTSFLAYQASPRGGELRVELAGERVKLGGRAITVLRGELLA